MTTATHQLDDVERRTIAAVKGLRSMQGVPVPELCKLLHISKATWYLRLSDGQFTVREVSRLAQRFGVTVQDIVDGRAYFNEGGQPGNSAEGSLTRRYNSPLLRLHRDETVQITPRTADLRAVE